MSVCVNWRAVAACRDADPDLFFPIGTTGPALRQIDEAKRICRTCPAQARCLAWALDHGVTDGVWGGTTENDRRALRSRPSRIAITPEDDSGRSGRRPEHGEPAVPAQAAQAQATRIRRGAGAGRASGGPGAELGGR
jgi:WhiB family redox-sensing transcriptional regulator